MKITLEFAPRDANRIDRLLRDLLKTVPIGTEITLHDGTKRTVLHKRGTP